MSKRNVKYHLQSALADWEINKVNFALASLFISEIYFKPGKKLSQNILLSRADLPSYKGNIR